MARQQLEQQAAAVIEIQRRESLKTTVFGIVCPNDGLIYSITKTKAGRWVKTDEKPSIFIAKKMEKVVRSKKRFIIIIGGRASSKSVGVVDICLADAKDTGAKTYCLREFQSSIKNSVHSLIKSEIDRFKLKGFEVLNNSIGFKGEQSFEFAGLARNIDSVKSTHGFKRFCVEEAQFISQESLDALTPTIREKPKNGLPTKFYKTIIEDIADHPNLMTGVSIIFIANPSSKADPFSKRFIEPFKSKLDKDGVYEDELHLVVRINYDDNPWFDDSGLESERAWDYENRSREYYYHRWHAEYNDTVDDAIIKPEWFDAAVDAHKIDKLKKVFEPNGAIIAAHDPSDTGNDNKGFALRHGSIIKMVKDSDTGEIDDGCDWATSMAIQNNADWFVWDGDGMGAGLKRQISDTFSGKSIQYHMFRGSLSGKGQDNASEIYMQDGDDKADKPKKYSDTFKNNRSQYYTLLANRFYNTYKCVINGEYIDPDDMISIDSDGCDTASLRAELCRIPLKNDRNGLIQIMAKQDMKALGIDSPNQGDCVMMVLFSPKAVKLFTLEFESHWN